MQDGPLTLVADARLYNREDLACALNVNAQGQSDAALILRAYRRWGRECLAHMNGDFGFAVHDRDAGEVFLARDHIGARPLYWARRGKTVMFATLVQGLTGFDDLDWPLNETRIAHYLCIPHDFWLESFLDKIETVGPGHWVRITAAGVTRQRWWDPRELPEHAGITSSAAQEELRRLTTQAVRARLPSAAPVGAHFSGGIDSSLVTILATRDLQARGKNLAGAYAWCPPVSDAYPDMGTGDERRVIAAQCADLGIPAHYGGAGAAGFDALMALPMEMQGVADLMDELPVIDQARADGLRVMLSGWGGDEVFSSHGIGHLGWLLRQGRLREVWRIARRNAGGLRKPHRMLAMIWGAALVPLMPDILYRRFTPIVDLYGVGAFPSAAMQEIHRHSEHPPELRLVGDANAYTHGLLLNGHLAERMATWAAWSAPAGFEYRYPLTDRKLLEFMLGLPQDIRFGDGRPRHLVWRAFADALPRGLKKNDLANEKLREDNRLEWLQMLSDRARQGDFDGECPWLDMAALKSAILSDPPADKLASVKHFAKIFVALRIHAMHARHGSAGPDASVRVLQVQQA